MDSVSSNISYLPEELIIIIAEKLMIRSVYNGIWHDAKKRMIYVAWFSATCKSTRFLRNCYYLQYYQKSTYSTSMIIKTLANPFYTKNYNFDEKFNLTLYSSWVLNKMELHVYDGSNYIHREGNTSLPIKKSSTVILQGIQNQLPSYMIEFLHSDKGGIISKIPFPDYNDYVLSFIKE